MARALVIGGTLFIGRALVEQLLDRGDDVVIMHRGKNNPFGDRVGDIRCDRNDVEGVRRALESERFDVVYDNVYDWERGTTAGQVTAAAIAAGDGLQRYVFISSVAAYGPGIDRDERGPLEPEDPRGYGRHKADSELALFDLHRERGIAVTTVRPAFVYGPRNPFDRESFFWDRIVAGRPVIIPGDGTRPMQWVHVDDVARCQILAAENPVAVGKAYALGNYPPVTQIEFVEACARAADKPVKFVHVPRERIQAAGGSLFAPPLYFGAYLDLPPIVVRTGFAQAELGLEPVPLDEGLRETFRWYREQPRPRPDFSWEDKLLASVQR